MALDPAVASFDRDEVPVLEISILLNRNCMMAKLPVVGGLGNGYLALGLDKRRSGCVYGTRGDVLGGLPQRT